MINDLPPMEFTFDLNQKGSKTKKIYNGSFTYRRLSIGAMGQAEVFRRTLNGGLEVLDAEIDRLHEMLGWLKHGLVDSPEWWKQSKFGLNLYDVNIVVDIYNRIQDFERDWSKRVEEDAKSTTEDGSKEDSFR